MPKKANVMPPMCDVIHVNIAKYKINLKLFAFLMIYISNCSIAHWNNVIDDNNNRNYNKNMIITIPYLHPKKWNDNTIW